VSDSNSDTHLRKRRREDKVIENEGKSANLCEQVLAGVQKI